MPLKPSFKSTESFMDFLNGDNKCITYELCPKKNTSIDDIANQVLLHNIEKKVAAFVCTDSPLARMRHSATLASIKFQHILKKPIICTISLRDKNSLALSSEIIGLNEFNIRLFLALSGDPLKLGDQHSAKAVFEGDSNKIIEIIEKINAGIDFSDNKINGEIRPIYPFSVINSYSNNLTNLKIKLEKKIIRGARAIFTQPIFNIANAKILNDWVLELNELHNKKCILMQGFFPVLKYKSAKFLKDKLPGVFIPDIWLEKLEAASMKGVDFERNTGLELSIKLYEELYNFSPKIHFMNNNDAKVANIFLNLF